MASERARRSRPAWLFLSGGLLALVFLSNALSAMQRQQPMEQLKYADTIKTSDYARFIEVLSDLERTEHLSAAERSYLRYLGAWQDAYEANYDTAIPELRDIAQHASDVTLKFRAGVTAVNVLVVAAQYSEAFAQLRSLIELLPKIDDGEARQQGLSVAAYLYNEVGEYQLGTRYADMVIAENWGGNGRCKGVQLKLEALSKSGRLHSAQETIQTTIDECAAIGEVLYANLIRSYLARLHIGEGHYEEAIELLNTYHDEVRLTRYPRLIAEYDALLAQAYWRGGEDSMAQEAALRAVTNSATNQYSEPLVIANRLLYEAAKKRGDTASALSFHERYAAADKGYLDDVSARQIAYEKVRHETLANQLQIDALNQQNEVLRLERENSRLYILLLTMSLAFIGYWAYRMKKSQVHFMKLSQKDGLTGISNRPYFLERAESLLESGKRSGQELCVVLCDLDNFKAINDKHGHATGDFVLKRTVAVCQSHLRPEDMFGRFGGEEFAIVLDGCPLDVARQRCEQFREAIANIAVDEVGVELSVTASFGVASTGTSGYELRMLLAHADAALYQAKRAGRNRVVVYDAKQPPQAVSLASRKKIADAV